nr:probable serine/threonine protein kinase IRE [Ipomoea batatas]
MDITICAWDILLVKQGHGARRSFPYSMTISKVIIDLRFLLMLLSFSYRTTYYLLEEFILFGRLLAAGNYFSALIFCCISVYHYVGTNISKLLDIARSVANVNNDYSTLEYLLDRLEDLKYVIQDRKVDAIVVETFGRRIEKLLQ